VIQEESSIFLDVMVLVIVRREFLWTCVWFWMAAEIQLFECTDTRHCEW